MAGGSHQGKVSGRTRAFQPSWCSDERARPRSASTFSAGASWSPALLPYTHVLGSELAFMAGLLLGGSDFGVLVGSRPANDPLTNNILNRGEGPLCRFRNGLRVEPTPGSASSGIPNPAGRPTTMRPTMPAISCGTQK